jgi:hypothetical protein
LLLHFFASSCPHALTSRSHLFFAWGQDKRDLLANWHFVARRSDNMSQDTAGGCFDLDRRFVGLDFNQRFTFSDLLTLCFEPFEQNSGFLGHPQGRHNNFGGQELSPIYDFGFKLIRNA